MYPLLPKNNGKELAFENDVIAEICVQGDLSWGDASAILEAMPIDPIPKLLKSGIIAQEAAKKLLTESQSNASLASPR